MEKPTIILACPTCERTCRTGREIRPQEKMRCPGCNGEFYFHVHGNGAVELRPANEPSSTMETLRDLAGVESVTGSRLPPRVVDQGETKSTRRIFTSRRRNRPIGGYAPFEKSRSHIGMFAFFTILGLGVVAASWYVSQIDILGKAQGRNGANVWQNQDEGKRKEFQARQKRAMEKLKKQQEKVKSVGVKLEDGRLPGDQTHGGTRLSGQ
jgi:hypothetical protein